MNETCIKRSNRSSTYGLGWMDRRKTSRRLHKSNRKISHATSR
ncbi:MAG: hypothetical protein J7L14_03585 [Candidatus Diapherotrites archaeon]|nr:hypothetical protein [Candidatus Diapherotrites archaeon]